MAMWILKGLSLAGVVLCAVLMAIKSIKIKKSTEMDEVLGMTGEELWAVGKKKAI